MIKIVDPQEKKHNRTWGYIHSPEKAKRIKLCSSSHTVIKPPVWHSTLPFSRQIDTAEARSFSEFWNKSRQALSSFLMGVENGVFQENKTASLAAIFRLRALRWSPLAISIGGTVLGTCPNKFSISSELFSVGSPERNREYGFKVPHWPNFYWVWEKRCAPSEDQTRWKVPWHQADRGGNRVKVSKPSGLYDWEQR